MLFLLCMAFGAVFAPVAFELPSARNSRCRANCLSLHQLMSRPRGDTFYLRVFYSNFYQCSLLQMFIILKNKTPVNFYKCPFALKFHHFERHISHVLSLVSVFFNLTSFARQKHVHLLFVSMCFSLSIYYYLFETQQCRQFPE